MCSNAALVATLLVGTPALTTRGMGVDEMRRVGQWMISALKNPQDEATHTRVRGEVSALCQQFPVPAARKLF